MKKKLITTLVILLVLAAAAVPVYVKVMSANMLKKIERAEAVLARAGESFPTPIGTLDALHLSTALRIRDEKGLDAILTHDVQLANAALAMGFKVQGV